ncbi:uncharacterized protein LOC129883677 [Solanum dulcamara]|uniref:uncharacterized protein LOC129883677 n=1 Tax=Solanum dulcamara TaxID=45834 RepID=UPI0024868C38|nr:uncharacterized protein LOC129883677 [Solanum dulcamara]
MVNTRYNDVRPVTPVLPKEEPVIRGHGRGRGRRGRGIERAASSKNEFEGEVEVREEQKRIEQGEGTHTEATSIPPLDPILAQQIMAFMSGIADISVTPTMTATLAPIDHPFVAADQPTNEVVGTDAFFRPLMSSVITSTEHNMLTKFLNIKHPVFHGTKNEDVYEFILNCYKRLHKLGIVYQHGVEFVTFQLEREAKQWRRAYVECHSPVYATLLVTTEEERIRLFVKGLGPELQHPSRPEHSPADGGNDGRVHPQSGPGGSLRGRGAGAIVVQVREQSSKAERWPIRMTVLSFMHFQARPRQRHLMRLSWARKMVRRGCLADFAHIRNVEVESPSIESIPVMCEFSEVFPLDLLGMPLDRDIDFYIDLEMVTHPISIPLPYGSGRVERA